MSKLKTTIAGAALGASLALISANAWAVTPIVDLGVIGADDSLSGSVVLTYSGGTLTYKFPTATFTQAGNAVDLGFKFEIAGTPLTLTYADAANPVSPGTQVLGASPIAPSLPALPTSPYIYLYDVTTSAAVTPDANFSYDAFAHSWNATTNSVTLNPGTYIEYVLGSAVSGKTNVNIGVFTGDVLAVPEPGTWALMLGGIALVGSALRLGRKQGAVTAA